MPYERETTIKQGGPDCKQGCTGLGAVHTLRIRDHLSDTETWDGKEKHRGQAAQKKHTGLAKEHRPLNSQFTALFTWPHSFSCSS